jgi:diguanylate cyclase (GGDEF)-like protein
MRLFGERETLDILVIDDDQRLADVVRRRLRRVGARDHRIIGADGIDAAAAVLSARAIDAIIIGVAATDLVGLERLSRLRGMHVDAPIVVLHHGGDIDASLEAVITGAQDVLPLTEANGTRLVRVLRAAMARKRVENAAIVTALTDPVTGLGARAWIEGSLDRAVTHAATTGAGWQVAVLYCDLDRFKHVNDTLGHGAGDELLKVVADRLRHVVRLEDPIGRFGGDEFVIVLEGHRIEALAQRVARRALESLDEPITLGQHSVSVHTSIGLAVWQPGESVARLLERADVALYRAKRAGRNQFVAWDDTLRAWADREQGRSAELDRALREGTLALDVRPLRDLPRARGRRVVVTAAWGRPELDAFDPPMSVATRHGKVSQLTAWLIDAAMELAARDPQHVSVEIPPAMTGSEELLAAIRRAGDRHDVDLDRLVVVVDQRDLADEELARPVLGALDELGVGVAVRGFGTGISSMTLMAAEYVDEIHLAPELCRGISRDPLRRTVLTGLLTIAEAVGQHVIARGIDDEADLACIVECGCHGAETLGLADSSDDTSTIIDLHPSLAGSSGAALR